MATERVTRKMIREWPILLWAQLTTQEFRCAELAALAWHGKAAAKYLGMSHMEFKNRLREVYRKFGISSQLELVLFYHGYLHASGRKKKSETLPLTKE